MIANRHLVLPFAILLIAAPLPFGAVEPRAAGLLAAACFVFGVAWFAAEGQLRGHPLTIVGLAFLAVALLQTVPLPPGLIGAVSPEAAILRARHEPAAGTPAENPSAQRQPEKAPPSEARPANDSDARSVAGSRPLSLHPWATWRAAMWVAACLIVVLVAADLAAAAATRRVLVGAIIASGAFQALYGLAEYVSGRQQIFGYAKRHYTEVATGTFINRNHFAGYLEMTLPLAIAALATVLQGLGTARDGSMRPASGGLARRLAASSGRELFTASALFLAALTMATAIVCSRSRMGIAGAVVALGVIALVQFRRGRGIVFGLSAFAVAIVALILLIRADATAPILERFARVPGELEVHLGRWSIWTQAAELVRRFPLAGVGLGAFGAVMPAYRTAGPGFVLEHAHNDYLELAGEVGLLGCGVILAGVLVATRRWLRGPARPDYGVVGYGAAAGLVAMAFHSLADFNLRIPANALTAAALIGILTAWRSIPGRSPASPRLVAGPEKAAWSRRWATRVVPALILAGLAFLTLAPIEAVRRNDPDVHFAAASAIGQATMGDLRALVESENGGAGTREAVAGGTGDGGADEAATYLVTRMRQAVALQERGVRMAPTLAASHLALADLKLGLCAAELFADPRSDPGCVAEALEEMRAGLRLAPLSSAAHLRAARTILASGMTADRPTATIWGPILRRSLDLNPADVEIRRAVEALAPPGSSRGAIDR